MTHKEKSRYLRFNPLSPKIDENEISLYINNTCLNIQVMRIKKVITKDVLIFRQILFISSIWKV